jgi:hypothetical protein
MAAKAHESRNAGMERRLVRPGRPSLRRRWKCLVLGHAWRPTSHRSYGVRCQRCLWLR